MAEEINKTYTSNSLYNDSTGVIAFAEQLKQELINWANYQHVTEELGQNRPDLQNELNNLFLSVYERFLTFLNDADASEEAINTWKEIENFLADYTDEKTLASIVAELNNKIESRLAVPLENTTGSSTTSTMTQKAITETINASKTFTTGEKVDNVGIDDEPIAGSDNLVKSGGVQNELALGAVYDVSAKNPTAGPNNDGKWESLSVLLSDANLSTLIPVAVRKGGMSIKFVQSSDNKYVQYRLMSNTFNTTVANWQGVDAEPTAGSHNLVESGGVENINMKIKGLKTGAYNANTLLFTSNTIQSGTLFSYSIIASDSYGYIGFYDSSDNRLALIGKGSSGTRTLFEGCIVIPSGYAYAKVMSGDITLNKAIFDLNNIEIRNGLYRRYGSLCEVKNVTFTTTGYLTKQGGIASNNNSYVSDELYLEGVIAVEINAVPVNNNAFTYSFRYRDVEAGFHYPIPSTDDYGFNGHLFITKDEFPSNAEYLYISGSTGVTAKLYYIGSNQNSIDIKTLKEENGFLINNYDTYVGEVLFTSEDVPGGSSIYYKFSVTEGKSHGCIEVVDTNGNITYIGNYLSTDTELNFEGSYELPLNFAKVMAGYPYGNISIDYITTDYTNKELSRRIKSVESHIDFGIKSSHKVDKVSIWYVNSSPVISTASSRATEWDNGKIAYPKLLKINDSLFYLYYNAYGRGELADKTSFPSVEQHLCFAYATSINGPYTHAIPSGIEAPIQGTNKLFENGVLNVDVVKVADSEYPYRMVATDAGEGYLKLYKSDDAVNWVFICNLSALVTNKLNCDSQSSIIVRGNLLKIYHRRWESIDGVPCRINGVICCDINGENIVPSNIYLEEKNLYNSAASIWSESDEFLLPTRYYAPAEGGDSHCELKAYLLGSNHYKEMTIENVSTAITNNDKFFLVAPGVISISDESFDVRRYFIMYTQDWGHDDSALDDIKSGTAVSAVKLVQFKTWDKTLWR